MNQAPQRKNYRPEDPLLGQVVHERYLVQAKLGEGGMGMVYRVKHIELGKTLVMKILRPETIEDPTALARFRQEAQSASSIGSPHIIDIHDFNTLPNGTTFFTMDYLEGQTLTDAIGDPGVPMPLHRVLHISQQLCKALAAAHARDIVHRDLKPDNIFLVTHTHDIDVAPDPDFVKVLDFGIAKVGSSTSEDTEQNHGLTQTGQAIGSPYYMSPEQCRGKNIDFRTDIYSLGLLIYEMLTGLKPFHAESFADILIKHCTEPPTPPSQLLANVPADLESIILKCLSKSKADRFQSMEALRQALLRRVSDNTIPNMLPSYSGIQEAVDDNGHDHLHVDVDMGMGMGMGAGVNSHDHDFDGAHTNYAKHWKTYAGIIALLALLGVAGAFAYPYLTSGDDVQTQASVLMDRWTEQVLHSANGPSESRQQTEQAITDMQTLLAHQDFTEAERAELTNTHLNVLYKQLALQTLRELNAETAKVWQDIPRRHALTEKALQDMRAMLGNQRLTDETKTWMQENLMQRIKAALGNEIHRHWGHQIQQAANDQAKQRQITENAIAQIQALLVKNNTDGDLTTSTKASLDQWLTAIKEQQMPTPEQAPTTLITDEDLNATSVASSRSSARRARTPSQKRPPSRASAQRTEPTQPTPTKAPTQVATTPTPQTRPTPTTTPTRATPTPAPTPKPVTKQRGDRLSSDDFFD